MSMSIHDKPSIADYWSTDFTVHQEFIPHVFNRDRFFQNVRAFRVCPPTPPGSTLYQLEARKLKTLSIISIKSAENFIV